MNKLLKNRKGITLIALVITIIVLLILAGVTIVTLTGDNGIIQNSLKAKKETKKAQYIEALQIMTMQTDNIEEIEQLCKLEEIFRNSEYTTYDDGKILIVKTQDNYQFMVREKEVVEIEIINIEDGSVIIQPEYYIQNEEKINYNGKNFLVTGQTTENTLTIAGDSNNNYCIYMYNLSVQVGSLGNTCAFNILEGANVETELIGINTLISGSGCAGLQKSSMNGELVIKGKGKLSSYGGTYSAGIGGGSDSSVASCTNITIKDGVIYAESGNLGPGIGSGYSSKAIVDNIKIEGGEVTAKGNNAGIGTGRSGQSCSNIVITGGKLQSYSWYEGCGIGGHNLSNVKIAGGTLEIYTTIGSSCPAIGNRSGTQEVNNITITGGNVYLHSNGNVLIGTPNAEISPTDNDGNEVLCTTVTLNNIKEKTRIKEIIYSNYSGIYGVEDMYTTKDGKIYLWLPADTQILSIKTDDNTYTTEKTIVAGESGILYE